MFLIKKLKKKIVSTLDKLKNHIDGNPHLLHHERTKKSNPKLASTLHLIQPIKIQSRKSSQKIKYQINKCNLHDQRPKKKKKDQMKSQRENPDETQRLPHRNPHCFHSQSPSLISLSVCGLVLLHLPLLKTLSSIVDFVFAGIIPEMRGRTQLSGCARRGGSRVSGYRRRLLGLVLLAVAATAWAIVGGG